MPKPLSANSPDDRARAAAKLLALSRRGHVYEPALLEHGRVLLGHDLNARRWHLPGLGKELVSRGSGLAALRLALALAVSPRRVRLGTAWVKDAAGQVDRSCVPADLEPYHFAQWLRAETLAQLRQMVAPGEKPRREARAPRKYRRAALFVLGEFTHEATRGPEEAMIALETLGDLLALATEGERAVIRMRIDGHSPDEIAARLGVSDRTIRRHVRSLHDRARAAGVIVARVERAVAPLRAANSALESAIAKAA